MSQSSNHLRLVSWTWQWVHFTQMALWRVGRGREPWERSEAGGVNDNERHLRHSPVSRLPLSSLLLLFLPKLLRGTRDRWVAQVSFIIIHSTGLAPFPRLSAPPHSSQASTVTRSQSNRAYLGCGGTGDSHRGCAADKSAATAWCYHVNMDQNLWWMFPTPCWVYNTNN